MYLATLETLAATPNLNLWGTPWYVLLPSTILPAQFRGRYGAGASGDS